MSFVLRGMMGANVASNIIIAIYSMSWNFNIARPGISEWQSLRTTSCASSGGKTECGGGSI